MSFVNSVFFALSSNTWDGLSDGVAILIIAILLIIGIGLGYGLRSLVGQWQADAIEKKMKLKENAFQEELKTRREKSEIEAKIAVVQAEEKFHASTKEIRAELDAASDRLTQRELNLDKKATLLDKKEAAVNEKLETAEKQSATAKETMQKASEKLTLAEKRLESLARMTHDAARKEIFKRENDALREDAAILSSRIQSAAREQGETIARRIIAEAIQRTAVSHLSEMTTTTVVLPNDEMKGRIVGLGGRNVRAFEGATGVSLLLDDLSETVVLSSFDPLRRAIAKRALEALVADGRIHPANIEQAVETATNEVDKMCSEAGEAAAAEAGVIGLSFEITHLMGSLKFRTSFSQNVLRHSIEVALLVGAMAHDMGLDAAKARRAGFLHDIGKALSSEKKGAHATLGADFLRARGEEEEISLAVASHHAEAGIDGGVLGLLCAAADAISSARPGARQENLGEYIQRLEQIEGIARKHEGVVNVFAVQAGRDLRVIVNPSVVSDQMAMDLAKDICREISAQMKFPGQIRVTIVRELRCTEYAK